MGVLQPLRTEEWLDREVRSLPVRNLKVQDAVDAIEHILRNQAHLGDWPERLSDRYRVESEETLFAEHRFLLLLGFSVAFATLALDVLVNPAMVDEGAMLRFVATVPLSILGLVAGLRRWKQVLIFTLGAAPIAFVGVLVHLAIHLPPIDALRYMLGSAFVVALGNVSLPFSIRSLAVFNTLGLAVAVAVVASGGLSEILAQAHNLATVIIIGFATLPLAVRIERLRRHNFLLNLRMQLVSTQLVDANSALRELSETDALTGVGNRRWFEAQFEELVVQADGSPGTHVGLMMIDLDHFKPFNDHHGHQAGDVCLKLVAGTLAEVFAEAGGLFARYGGEEFIAALAADDTQTIIDLAERARTEVAATLAPVPGTGPALVTASIGVAVAPQLAQLPREELIEMADAALYSGKNAGRNRVEVVEASAPMASAEAWAAAAADADAR